MCKLEPTAFVALVNHGSCEDVYNDAMGNGIPGTELIFCGSLIKCVAICYFNERH